MMGQLRDRLFYSAQIYSAQLEHKRRGGSDEGFEAAGPGRAPSWRRRCRDHGRL
ncbi:hypothetical protein Srot_0659 [Segniliparus rotundus DSM 44985]|uniref:Uncharacterized protein n=1 Tax=Segniliparus rotundus (strain ATCC BAA-972 / CDC 1076 / CIP 108378 / DSM 44985 / JCM 13578) TaxID=640132 RepID=D6ZD77_SEGRD|nr:hypothetical protein Srot_0659 [Segniliparus rotundus DSM 44985]